MYVLETNKTEEVIAFIEHEKDKYKGSMVATKRMFNSWFNEKSLNHIGYQRLTRCSSYEAIDGTNTFYEKFNYSGTTYIVRTDILTGIKEVFKYLPDINS